MRINIIIPFDNLTGGIRGVYEIASCLKKKGHTVKIFCPKERPRLLSVDYLRFLKRRTFRIFCLDDFSYFNLRKMLYYADKINDNSVADGDVVIATSFKTAYWVNDLSGRKGRKFYYIMHYENWGDGVKKEDVDRTWRIPLKRIVIAEWLRRLGEEEFKVDIAAKVNLGVNLRQFYRNPKIKRVFPTIGMVHHKLDWKGMGDGIKALEIVSSANNNVNIVMFGHARRRPRGLPGYIRYFPSLPQDRLRGIYSMCDIWIMPSHSEGFGLPALEAMACGCGVVSTACGGIDEFGKDNYNCLIAPIKNPAALAEKISLLINDKDLLARLQRNGLKTCKDFEWEKIADDFERVLEKV